MCGCGGCVSRTRWAKRCRPCCALRWKTDGPLPGVVCIPGTGGSAESITRALFNRADEPDEPVLGWSRELARRGFVTLAVTVKGTEARWPSGTAEGWAIEGKLLAPYGRTQMGIVVEEVLSAARVLASCDGVDGDRIGLTGMSLGGNATWYSMACDPSIAAGAPICGSPSSLDVVSKLGDPLRHSAYFYIPTCCGTSTTRTSWRPASPRGPS